VPELTDGTVEIVNIAREPGHRTKIAVISHDPNVDPKGACVGARGSRVRQVVNELRGEKVDVVQWRDDIGQFIAEALGPAKVKEVHIDEETKTADVVVSEHQLSLAIGKEGQNARLAARLSGYKVDIRSDNQGVPEEVVTEEVVTEEKVIEDVASEETAATDAVGDETSLAEEASDVVTEEVTEVVTVETETVEAEPDEDAADAEETVAPSVDLGESASDDEDAVVTADEDEESE
jgi:N utilization substance protein A